MQRTKIQCYASGSGALSFARIKPNGMCGMPVTLGDAKRWLATTKEGKRLTGNNWELQDNYGHPLLVKKVERLADDQLRIDGKVYTYGIESDCLFADGRISDRGLYVTFKFDGDDREHELKNISIRAEIRYFLEHELCPTADVGHA